MSSVSDASVSVDEEQQYEVQDILSKRFYDDQVEYYVKWKGYDDPSENTWQSVDSMTGCKELIENFEYRWARKYNQSTFEYDERDPKVWQRRTQKRWKGAGRAPRDRDYDPESVPKLTAGTDSTSDRSDSSDSDNDSSSTSDSDSDQTPKVTPRTTKRTSARPAVAASSVKRTKTQQDKTTVVHNNATKSSVSAETTALKNEPNSADKKLVKSRSNESTISNQSTNKHSDKIPKAILGVTDRLGDGKISYLVEWKEQSKGQEADLCDTDWVAANCPKLALEFFEKRIRFTDTTAPQ